MKPRHHGIDPDLPSAFVERLGKLFGDRLAAVMQAMQTPRRVGVRLNPLSPAVDSARIELTDSFRLEPYGDFPDLFVADIDQRSALTHAPLVSAGAAWLQNPSSWLPVLALAPNPGEQVCDLAAAPGGKASHIAACMANRGRLAVVEPVRGRFFRLHANLQRLGVTNAAFYSTDGRAVGRKVPERFDRVLLDAPCSSEARMRAGERATLAHWSLRKIRECARKQTGLLASAWQALRPGGELVYCTCSFAPEENEAVVSQLLQVAGSDAEVLELPAFDAASPQPGLAHWQGRDFDPRLAHAARIVPDGCHDAMFICRLRKSPAAAPPLPVAGRNSRPVRRRR